MMDKPTYNTVVQSITDPEPEGSFREERVLLAEHIELGISIQNSRGYKLVEDANDQGRENGENNIV
jgi:hypothetical protein